MKLTRELGRALQQDQTYINMSVAEQQCNEDEALQNAIGEFNLKRMAINNEAGKEDRSEELIEQYNKELREIYGRVMQNEHMAAYQAAKNEFDALMQRVGNAGRGGEIHIRDGEGHQVGRAKAVGDVVPLRTPGAVSIHDGRKIKHDVSP